MGRLPPDLEEKRQRLLSAARRGAFDSYVRRGRVPKNFLRIVELTQDAKALAADTEVSLTPQKGEGRPTVHYVWRTAGDDRVRSSHAVLAGRVFSWADPPPHGHPGTEPNCRCWPEPYYGDPAVPDAMLKLVRQRKVDTGSNELWASIETVSRPDGSLAESGIVLHDGTEVHSTLTGSRITQTVSFPDRSRLQILQDGDTRSYATGNGQSLRVAWLGRALFPRFLPPLPLRAPATPSTPRHTDGQSPTDRLLTPAAIILRGAAVLHQMLTSAPQTMGASPVDTPAMAFGAWDYSSSGSDVAPVMTGTLTREQAAQFCPFLPQAQAWADEAAAFYEPVRAILGSQVFGISVHSWIKSAADSVGSPNLKAEYTIEQGLNNVPGKYAALGSLRLDLIHFVPETGTACVFDFKTGNAHLYPPRIVQIAAAVAKHFGFVQFIIIEIRPGE